jgi:EAL domain-containing protein (putative c-di-GMP-specific phosphodiesterase class I)
LWYLRRALEDKAALLAYHPIVAGSGLHSSVFYEGLIQILDPTGRIIPARDFVFWLKKQSLGDK